MTRLLIVCALCSCVGCFKPTGPTKTLTYKIEKNNPADRGVDLDQVVAAVKRRLKSGDVEYIEVNSPGVDQVAVVLPDTGAKIADQAKELLDRPGHLEFRIIADKLILEHLEVIEAATKTASGKDETDVRDSGMELIGKWVKLGTLMKPADTWSCRKAKDGTEEVLVLIDEYNVSGAYLESARPGSSDQGSCVSFSFNAEGAMLFGELTATNLPDPVSGIGRELAIILDNEIRSAATIRSRITSSGQITNPLFTETEVKTIVSILDSGQLPAKLKLVSEVTAKAP